MKRRIYKKGKPLLILMIMVTIFLILTTEGEKFTNITVNQYKDGELIKTEGLGGYTMIPMPLMSLVGLGGICSAGICCDENNPNICWNENIYELNFEVDLITLDVWVNNIGNTPLNISFSDSNLHYWTEVDATPIQNTEPVATYPDFIRLEVGENNISTTVFIDVSGIKYIDEEYKNYIQFDMGGISDHPELGTTNKTFKWYFKEEPHWIYQEDADIFACEGSWSKSNSCRKARDGSWKSYGSSSGIAWAYYYANYSKTFGTLSTSLWLVKDGAGIENLTIPIDCWNQDPLRFKVETRASETSFVTFSCWDGASFGKIVRASISQNEFYEEAMRWHSEDV